MRIIASPTGLRKAVLVALSLLILGISCKKEAAEPIASFSINSHVAYAGSIITVDASDSKDPDGDDFSLQLRWDFEDDGTWDTDYSFDKQVNWSFTGSGYHRIRLEVKDQDDLTSKATDSVNIFGPFPDSVILDARDNQQYRIVKINGIWIMAENLRYGKRIPSSIKQTDNDVVEYYVYDDDSANLPVYGGLYSQEEAMYYDMRTYNQGICPKGWRIPNRADWNLIDIKVVHYFISDYYGPDGISGLNLQFGGHFINAPEDPNYQGMEFIGSEVAGQYWTTYYRKDENDGFRYQGVVEILSEFDEYAYIHSWTGLVFYNLTDRPSDSGANSIIVRDWYISVRCVHD